MGQVVKGFSEKLTFGIKLKDKIKKLARWKIVGRRGGTFRTKGRAIRSP